MDDQRNKEARIDFFIVNISGASFAIGVILGGLTGLTCSLKGWHFWASFGVGLIGLLAINAVISIFLKIPDQEIKRWEIIVRSTVGHLLGYAITFSIVFGLVALIQRIFRL